MTNGKLEVEARRLRNTIDPQLQRSALEQGEKEGRPEALLSHRGSGTLWPWPRVPLLPVFPALWLGLLLISNQSQGLHVRRPEAGDRGMQ